MRPTRGVSTPGRGGDGDWHPAAVQWIGGWGRIIGIGDRGNSAAEARSRVLLLCPPVRRYMAKIENGTILPPKCPKTNQRGGIPVRKLRKHVRKWVGFVYIFGVVAFWRFGSVRFGSVRSVWFGLVWFGLVWFDFVWFVFG